MILTTSKGQICFEGELKYELLGYIANILDYPPELGGKTQLTETPHTWGTEHEEIKLVLNESVISTG